MTWAWWRRKPPCDTADSRKAVEDSRRSLEASRERWPRVEAVADRAEQARRKVASQRDQNHLAEIMKAALLGGKP